MGHAVGMLHEHAQAKTKCTITPETVTLHEEIWAEAGVKKNDVVGTSYDPYSIMNYCYILQRSSGFAAGFSNKDIQTVNALYL